LDVEHVREADHRNVRLNKLCWKRRLIQALNIHYTDYIEFKKSKKVGKLKHANRKLEIKRGYNVNNIVYVGKVYCPK